MKFFILTLASVLAMGSTSLAKQLVIDGQQSQYKAQTTAEVTHTEYTQEEQNATCSRQVAVGSHEVCGMVPGEQICNTVGGDRVCHEVGGGEQCDNVGGGEDCDNVGGGEECETVGGGQECGLTPSGYQCHDVPGHRECHSTPGQRVCHQTPGQRVCHQTPSHEECYNTPGHRECYQTPGHRECHSETEYRTEYYSCTQTVTVPHVIKDLEVENNIVVNVEINRNLPSGLREVIELVQTAEALTLQSVESTAKVLVYATQTTSEVSNNGRLKKLKTVISIKLIDRAAALGAFLSPISEITADSNGMQITTGLITDPASVRFDVDLRRTKLFGKDEVVLQKSFLASEATLTNSGQQTVVNFDFLKLGIQDKIAGKKVHIALQVQSNLKLDSIVNRQDIPANINQKKELQKRL